MGANASERQRLCPERDGDITANCVDDALGQNGAKFGHDVFVFIADDFA